MPPLARRAGNPSLTPQQSVRRGLRVDDGIMQFSFQPSIGISARAIDRLGIDIRSFREPLKRVVQKVMAPSFLKNFQAGGRPDLWPDLADATIAIREREGINHASPLIRSGLLLRTSQQLNIWTITQETATIRDLPEKVWYGKVHQGGFGGTGGGSKMTSYLKKAGGDGKEALKLLDDDLIMSMRTGKKMHGGARTVAEIPARPFIVIQDEDYDEIEKVFVEWLQERALRAGFVGGSI